ncbi:MAG: undecaprenyl/decaprenyl-phosphate alpha-N-acetylglucosaminyl 1-phosphate transferase [Chloroherpetonaceae bacterium]|nr:undecaprenyl/decaprenyl-phosphate alpha-N-acetylglucosaminyl 1-phosphate transferase [Chloroherpetonaceae bacterium]
MSLYVIAVLLGLSTITAWLFTPKICQLSRLFQLLDEPAHRKVHSQPIPRLGGIAIALTFLLTTLVALIFWPDFYAFTKTQFWAVLLGSVIIFATGLLDDIRGLDFRRKFLMQFLAAAIVVFGGGYSVRSIELPFLEQPLLLSDWLSLGFTFLWIVGICNAINLVDGLDGLAGGVSSIALLFMMASAFLNHDTLSLAIYASLLGGILGFLRYNFHPAQIFMGDAGALFIGFMLACSTIPPSTNSVSSFSLFTPVFALAFPILDTVLAPVRRLLSGKHPFKPDMLHLHHRLLHQLCLNQRQAVIFIYLFSLLTGLLAFVHSALAVLGILILYVILGVGLLFVSRRNSQREAMLFATRHSSAFVRKSLQREKLLS